MVIVTWLPVLRRSRFCKVYQREPKKIAGQIIALNENYPATEHPCRDQASNSSTHRTINYHVPWVIRPPVNLLRMLINASPSKRLIFASMKWNNHLSGLYACNSWLFTHDSLINYRLSKNSIFMLRLNNLYWKFANRWLINWTCRISVVFMNFITLFIDFILRFFNFYNSTDRYKVHKCNKNFKYLLSLPWYF